jgi:membrane-associated phospholipid phosphatase
VRSGAHYSGDVVVGALIGTTIGESVSLVARALTETRSQI